VRCSTSVGSPTVLWGIRYHIVARNSASASENRIHADEVARRYGFRGGLVPGATVYGYLAHALVEALGPGWVAHGITRARFVAPCYDGDELLVSVHVPGFEVKSGERTCVVGSAALCRDGADGLDIPGIPTASAPAPEDRPLADEDSLAVGRVLGSVALPSDWPAAAAYLDRIREPSALFVAGGIIHPGMLLEGANRILMAHVVLPAWLHVETEIEHRRAVTIGERLEVRARVGDLFERKGHHFVVLDVTWLVGDEMVSAAHHTAIWQLARA
jgi:acyl dehydratase